MQVHIVVLLTVLLLLNPSSGDDDDVVCSRIDRCGDCTSNNCSWCGMQSVCTATNATCSGCLKTNPTQCPSVPSCKALSNCSTCVTAVGCRWCADTQTCDEISADGESSCGTSNICSDNSPRSGCWKNTTEQCPSQLCSPIADCVECSQTPGCTWCADHFGGACLELTSYGNATCSLCEEGCAKTTPEVCPHSPNTNESFPCIQAESCDICALVPNCGWCSSDMRCYEASAIGLLPVCAVCSFEHWFVMQCTQPASISGPTASDSLASSTIGSSSSSLLASSTTSGPFPSPSPAPHHGLGLLGTIILVVGAVSIFSLAIGIAIFYVMRMSRAPYEQIN